MNEDRAEQPLRYRIKSLMGLLTPKEKAAIKEAILQENGIKLITYKRYLNLRKNDSVDMPARMLNHFAKLLGTTSDALFNIQEENAETPALHTA